MMQPLKWLKKYFIPHEENQYKPHFLRQQAVLVVFLLIIVVELGFLAQVFIVFDKTKFLAAVLPGVLTNLTNEEREDNNIPPLAENDLLTQAAQLKAQDMAAYGYFAHTSPNGVTPWHWLDVVGYRYAMAGENLAVNFYESEDVDEAWMNSPTHRANMLKSGYTEIGIGVAKGKYQGQDTVFVAQFFGTPIKITAAPSNVVASAPPTPTPTVKPAPKPTPSPIPTPTAPKPPTPTPTPTQIVQAPSPTPLQVLGEKTATGAAAAEKAANQSKIKQLVQRILTQPMKSINYTYGVIGIIIILALLLAIFIKTEIQHPLVIARGVALVAVIVFLFYLNTSLLPTSTEAPPEGLSASVIVAY